MTSDFWDLFDQTERQDVFALMKFIGAIRKRQDEGGEETCLLNLQLVLDEVAHLLPLVEQFANDSEISLKALGTVEKGLSAIERELKKISSDDRLLLSITPSQNSSQLMHGKLLDFPLYSLLPYQPSDQKSLQQARAYVASLLIANHELTALGAALNREYQAAIGSAARALRLSIKLNLLENLPTHPGDLFALQEKLTRLRADGETATNKTEFEYLRAIETVFRYLATCIGGHRRSKKTSEIDSMTDETEKQHNYNLQITRTIDLPVDELRLAKKSGLAPSELGSDIEHLTIEVDESEDEDPIQPKTLARQARVVQQRLEAIERNAQLLPSAVSRLNPWEAAVFLRTLKHETLAAESRPEQRVETSDGVAALITSFSLSKKLPDTFHLTIYKTAADLPLTLPKSFIGYLQSEKEWVLPTLRPKGEPKFSDVSKSAACAVQDRIRLPDMVDAGRYLRNLKSWARADEHGSASAFELPGRILKTECERLIKVVNTISNGRVTGDRVANCLFLRSFDRTPDLASSSLVFARPHRQSDTPLHYTTLDLNTIQGIYRDTCQSLSEQVIAELQAIGEDPYRPGSLERIPEKVEGSVGCPICPSDASMSELAQVLRSGLDHARRQPFGQDYWINFANEYTSYTIVLLIHLTALRAVKKLIPTIEHIDFLNRVMLGSDKDDYTAFNLRLIPLADIVVRQLKYFLAHREAVIGRLSMHSPEIARALGSVRPKDGLFFNLVRDGDKIKVSAMSPARIQSYMSRHFPDFGLPVNCQRSRLRNALLHRGCFPQWINAFLGHWTRGQEPTHRYSSSALKRICDGVREHLDAIADQDGWQAVRGFA